MPVRRHVWKHGAAVGRRRREIERQPDLLQPHRRVKETLPQPGRMLLLVVPYAESGAAKAAGARWSADHRRWWIDAADDLTPFDRWLPRAQS